MIHKPIHHGKRLASLLFILGYNQTAASDAIGLYSKQSVQYHLKQEFLKKDILDNYRKSLEISDVDFDAFMFSSWGIDDLMNLINHYRNLADHWKALAESKNKVLE